VDEESVPIFQDVARGYPPCGDDVYPFPPVVAAGWRPAPWSRHRGSAL